MIENETSKAFLDEQRLAMLKAHIARFMEVMQGDGEEAAIARQHALPLIVEGQDASFYLGMYHSFNLCQMAIEQIGLSAERAETAIAAMAGVVATLYTKAAGEFPSEIEPDAQKG